MAGGDAIEARQGGFYTANPLGFTTAAEVLGFLAGCSAGHKVRVGAMAAKEISFTTAADAVAGVDAFVVGHGRHEKNRPKVPCVSPRAAPLVGRKRPPGATGPLEAPNIL